MLLTMVILTQTDDPAIGRLQRDPAIRTGANMSAFDRSAAAATNRAEMTAHPRAMAGAGPADALPFGGRPQTWDEDLRHVLLLGSACAFAGAAWRTSGFQPSPIAAMPAPRAG